MNISKEQIDEIKSRVDISDIISETVALKKSGKNHFGCCPFHQEKTPSFSTNSEKQIFYCFGCGESGDVIQFLVKATGKTFNQAIEYLAERAGIALIPGTEYIPTDKKEPKKNTKPEFTPSEHQSPADLWQERAQKFVSWAHENLKQNKEVMDWLANRGISAAAVDKYHLGWNPGENGKDIYRPRQAWGLAVEIKEETGKPKKLWIPIGLVVPLSTDTVVSEDGQFQIVRIRIRRADGEPRYYVIPGSAMSTMILEPWRKAFVIVESELDAIAVTEASDLAGAVAMGSSHTKPDKFTYAILRDSTQILNALDYDKAGASAMIWWDEQFNEPVNPARDSKANYPRSEAERGPVCDRWPVPKGKDPGEAFALGIDLKSWIEAGLVPALTLGKSETGKVKSEKDSSPSRGEDKGGGENIPTQDTPELLKELYKLLRDNPGVKIINTPERLTVLKNDRYVGGRINELVMKPGEVNDYLLSHPDQEITWKNLLI